MCTNNNNTQVIRQHLSQQQKWALNELKRLGLWGSQYKIKLHDSNGGVQHVTPPAAKIEGGAAETKRARGPPSTPSGAMGHQGGAHKAVADHASVAKAAAGAGGVAGAGAGSKEEDYHEYVKPVKEDDLPSGWKVLRVQTLYDST